jgi:hypothetical protein
MNEEHCFGTEDLDALLSMPKDDPRHRHLESCSACRSQLAAYRRYLDPDGLPTAARQAEAHQELQRFIEEQIGVEETATTAAPSDPFSLKRFLTLLRGPALRPALAMVIVLTAVTILWSSRESLSPERRSGIVREFPDSGAGDTALMPVGVIQDGAGLLSWQAVAEADAYRVQILSADLTLLEEIEAGDRLSLLRELSSTDAFGFWRVIAQKQGDEIARSGLITLP